MPASRIPDREFSKTSELRTQAKAPGLGPGRTNKARMPPRARVGTALEGAQELNMLVQELGEPALSRNAAHRNEGQLKNLGDQEIDEVAPETYEQDSYRPDS